MCSLIAAMLPLRSRCDVTLASRFGQSAFSVAPLVLPLLYGKYSSVVIPVAFMALSACSGHQPLAHDAPVAGPCV